ncbi:hypothetical protein [Demequina gelatinilytica]|uniref:hypothetical protein n=1 Tax=Demequina gelatinilytica TaxID=1638980 RepID=UPI0012E07114|nr:hypothetical protein [Demequina gelatinilytica]
MVLVLVTVGGAAAAGLAGPAAAASWPTVAAGPGAPPRGMPTINGAVCAEVVFAARHQGPAYFKPPDGIVPEPFRDLEVRCATRFTGDGPTYVLILDGTAGVAPADLVRALAEEGWGVVSASMDGGVEAFLEDPAWTTPLADYRGADLEQDILFVNPDEASPISTVAIEFPQTTAFADGRATLEIWVHAERELALSAPSSFTELRPIGQAIHSGGQVVMIACASVLLAVLAGYPSVLLNRVIGARWDRLRTEVGRRWVRVRDRAARIAPVAAVASAVRGLGVAVGRSFARMDAAMRRRAGHADDASVRAPDGAVVEPGSPARTPTSVWAGYVVAALIAGCVDPAFGFNWMSVRVLVSSLMAFVVFTVAVALLVRRVMARRHPGIASVIRFRWGTLPIVLATVVVARLIGMHPGVVFGMVAGLVLLATLPLRDRALRVSLTAGWALGIAAIGWIVYSLLSLVPSSVLAVPLAGVPLQFATDFAALLAIQGVSTLPLTLLPVTGLDGATLAEWAREQEGARRAAWLGAYAAALAVFMLVIVTVPDGLQFYGDFSRWAMLFVLYAAVAVAVFGVHVLLVRRAREAAASEAPPPDL